MALMTDKKNTLKSVLFTEVSGFICLWIIYFFLPDLLDFQIEGFHIHVSELVFTGYYILLTAFNNFYLMPKFLSVGKHLKYLGVAILLILIASFIEETYVEWLLGISRHIIGFSSKGFGYSIISIGTIMIIFASFKLMWEQQERLRKINELQKERNESELKFLKSQINPHVMFNNLNGIYYYAMEKSDIAPLMILKLSEVMRYMIYDAGEKYVSLEKELNYIQNFVELEKMRMGERGTVKFKMKGKPGDFKIAPLLLISFIENSFKHSLETLDKEIRISIKTRIENHYFLLTVENNWLKTNKDNSLNASGIGLQNVKRRLQLLYPGHHTLEINQYDNFFKVYLKIDLSYEEN